MCSFYAGDSKHIGLKSVKEITKGLVNIYKVLSIKFLRNVLTIKTSPNNGFRGRGLFYPYIKKSKGGSMVSESMVLSVFSYRHRVVVTAPCITLVIKSG